MQLLFVGNGTNSVEKDKRDKYSNGEIERPNFPVPLEERPERCASYVAQPNAQQKRTRKSVVLLEELPQSRRQRCS